MTRNITISKLAIIINRPVRTIERWMKKGKIPQPKREYISGYRVWSVEEVEKIKIIVQKHT